MEIIKNAILNYFKDLEFNEEKHLYTVDKKPLTSVSHKIKEFVIPFDTLGNAQRVADKRGITIEEVLKEWEDKKNNACDLGTNVHLFGEFYNGTQEPTNGYEEAIVKFFKIIPPHIKLIINELKMYNSEWGIAGTADLIFLNENSGKLQILDFKGLDINTPIPTDDGYKLMGELTFNDRVFDKDGNLCNIKNISEVHYKKCYKITFDTNEAIISDFEHRWLINKINTASYGKRKFTNGYKGKFLEKIMTTEDIFLYYQNKSIYKQPLKILNCKPLNNSKIDLPIDPYLLGVWLGDGHSADTKITQANEKVWEEIEKRGYTLGNDVSQGGCGKAQTRSVLNIIKEFKELNLIKNKHLPDIYLKGSYEQRLDVVRGLMDSDGHFNKKRKRFVQIVKNKWQVECLLKLITSLGWKGTIMESKTRCNGKYFNTYHLTFNTDGTNPFLCRNQDINITNTIVSNFRTIKKIELVNTIPTKCIEVDSPSHTYLFGYGHIVTHNTNKDLFKNFKGQTLLKPFDDILDCPYGKYILQLSYYQLLLEQTGYEVENRCLIWLKPDGTFTCHKTPDVTQKLLQTLI